VFAGVGTTYADVVQPAVVAQGDDSGGVDFVGANAVVPWRCLCRCWLCGDGFGAGGVGGGWGFAANGPVGSGVVVVVGEGVELGLQLGDRGRRVLAGQPAFEGLVEAFDLAAGLRVVGPGAGVGDAQAGDFGFQGAAATAGAAVKMAPLSVSRVAGRPCWSAAWAKAATTSAALNAVRVVEAIAKREWSSMMLQISTPVLSASCQWVVSACQRWFGNSAANRM
jgi:hypothetical protein